MLLAVCPKLPMRNKASTRAFYEALGFAAPNDAYPDYLMMNRDQVEIHFFLYPDLNPLENYGMCYIRISGVDALYEEAIKKQLSFPKAGHIETKPWRQREFSLLDPDMNLLTFGEAVG